MMSNSHSKPIQCETLRLWPEAATILGIGRTAAYEAARRGEIPTIKIGKLRLVPRKAIERLLAVADSYPFTSLADTNEREVRR